MQRKIKYTKRTSAKITPIQREKIDNLMKEYDFTESYIIRIAIDQLKIENIFNKNSYVENINKTNSINEINIIEDNSKDIFLTPKLRELLPYKEDILKMRNKNMSFKNIENELNKRVKGKPFKGSTIQSFLKELGIK
jgi:hypothetical protein